MTDYAALNREKRTQLAALTRAKNSGDPRKIVAAVDAAFARFNVVGWPDQWPTWQIAKDDAEAEVRQINREAAWAARATIAEAEASG